jgi:hypothetical protein
MYNSQFSSESVKSLRLLLIPQHLMRTPQIQKKRWIELLDSIIIDSVRMLQRNLIPMQCFFGAALKTCNIMGSNTGFVIVCI